MNRNTSIQLKAAFLLSVFALNTIVGFACAVGLDMGFNTKHHHEQEVTVTPIHVHADGKKHHHHDEAKKNHHEKKVDSKKDDCCKDEVTKFQNLDKALTQSANVAISAPVFVAIINTFFSPNFFNVAKVFPQKDKAILFHPPPPDILIAIQRFQI